MAVHIAKDVHLGLRWLRFVNLVLYNHSLKTNIPPTMSKLQSKLLVAATLSFLIAVSVLYIVTLPLTLRTLRNHFEKAKASKWNEPLVEFPQHWQFPVRLSRPQGIYLGKISSCLKLLEHWVPYHVGQRLGISFPNQRWSHSISHTSGRRSHALHAPSAALSQHNTDRLSWPARHNSIDYASCRLCRRRYVLGTTSPACNVQRRPHSRTNGPS